MNTFFKYFILFFILTFLLSSCQTTMSPKKSLIKSSWIDASRVMVIYNTTRMDSVASHEKDTFSKDMGAWYMQQYGMPTTHLFGYDMGRKVYWEKPDIFKFLKTIADYIKANKIQIVLLAPGTPIITRDVNQLHNLALDSLVGHALWFAHVKKEAPKCTQKRSVAPGDSNLYFPYINMGDGASPFVVRTRDARKWGSQGKDLLIHDREWYDTMMMDLRDHPSVRPYGRIGLPYYTEIFKIGKKKRRTRKEINNGVPETFWTTEEMKTLDIPKENSQFVKDLVLGGMKATTSIEKFNKQIEKCLLFFGRESNTASFIDVEASLNEAMAQYAIKKGIDSKRITRVDSGRWQASSPLKEPKWDYTRNQFMKGEITPGINSLIFSAGGVNNTSEIMMPWPKSLKVTPGMVAAVSVSNGKDFAGSMLKRGATTQIVNLHHPQNARLHAWFSVFRQLVDGATVCEAMITSGGSERGGYISGSIWGDPLYAPFGNNKKKVYWITGGKK